MFALNAAMIMINGLTLALSMVVLLIILWHDSSSQRNQFFAVFLVMIMLWNVGSLLLQSSELLVATPTLTQLGIGIMELGFTGSSVAAYILTSVMIGIHGQRFRLLAFTSLLVIVGYRIVLMIANPVPPESGWPSQTFQPLSVGFYLLFDGMALILIWQYRRKIRSNGLILGLLTFLVGQSLVFINPELAIASLSIVIGTLGALVISFALLHQEIIVPLSDRLSQIESMHQVSLAVTSQIAVDTVLEEITIQATGWLEADGAGIYLMDQNTTGSQSLSLRTVHDLPAKYLGMRIPVGKGAVGTAAQRCETIFLESYNRDWHGEQDLPLARDTFGSFICAPLIYANEIIGVLMVVAGRRGKLFDRGDVYLLELLCAQAAVAIAHGRLFAEQQGLTKKVEQAHDQLHTVLTSTENPVIALGRQFGLIFANPAAEILFQIESRTEQPNFAVDESLLPPNRKLALREIREKGGHVYEVTVADKTYMCHLASIGKGRIEGWVAVLNDITRLKELDRMKSEMVRMASHDLKNPLMGAMAYLDLLRDELADAVVFDANEIINTIEWQLERMHRLIRGILDVERVRNISTSMQLCSPVEIIQDAVIELQHTLQQEHIMLIADIPADLPQFYGDSEQLKRVFTNLLENAIKFTLQNGAITIRAHEENGQIIFEIEDNGVGIPATVQSQIFQRFFRGQQKGVEHVTGSGLGLSLAKTIVENHQGRIWFQSEEDEGTTFFISLPVLPKPITGFPGNVNSREQP